MSEERWREARPSLVQSSALNWVSRSPFRRPTGLLAVVPRRVGETSILAMYVLDNRTLTRDRSTAQQVVDKPSCEARAQERRRIVTAPTCFVHHQRTPEIVFAGQLIRRHRQSFVVNGRRDIVMFASWLGMLKVIFPHTLSVDRKMRERETPPMGPFLGPNYQLSGYHCRCPKARFCVTE